MQQKLILCNLCILFVIFNSDAQISKESNFESVVLENTEVREISSVINGVDYKLYISVPESYEKSTKSYPVVYFLDADYSFALAKNITDHLSERNHLKEVILVGIAYTGEKNYRVNRTRDYTPTNTSTGGYSKEIQETHSGGGVEFLKFIETELIPFVNLEFRTTDEKIITGHSYGGLFASWVLLTNPDLFDSYLIVSPSIWYDDHLLLRMDLDALKETSEEINIYLTVGEREVNSNWDMPQDLKKFKDRIQDMGNSYLRLKINIENNQTHNSIFPIGLSNGLRYVLKGI